MTSIPEQEPNQIRAGETTKWTKDLSEDYPADDGWTLEYTLINSTTKITVNASASGSLFSVTITAAVTAAYAAGIYQWIARVSKSAEVYTADEGHIEVLPDVAALTTYDHRTHVKKVLDAIEAVLEKRAGKDSMQLTVDGNTLGRTTIPDLLILRDKYKNLYRQELDAEKVANGKATGRRILTRFN